MADSKKTEGLSRFDLYLDPARKTELMELSGDLAVPARDLAALAIYRMLRQRDRLASLLTIEPGGTHGVLNG